MTTDPAVTTCFFVEIDNKKLGSFTSCEGLGAEVVIEARQEGGNNSFIWQLPTMIKYPNIKLTRAISEETRFTAEWFASMAHGVRPGTATIAALNAHNDVVAKWELLGVVPVRWQGPSLNVESPKVATETIEIAHHGILPAQRGGTQ